MTEAPAAAAAAAAVSAAVAHGESGRERISSIIRMRKRSRAQMPSYPIVHSAESHTVKNEPPPSPTKARARSHGLCASSLQAIENSLTILNHQLHRLILDLRIRHLPRQTLGSHNRRRKHNRDIHARHEVLAFMAHHPLEMKDQKLKDLSVHPRQVHQCSGYSFNLGIGAGDGGCFEEFVVDFVGDERVRQAAEVLLQRGRDGVDVEVGVGNVKVLLGRGFEAVFEYLDLAGTAGFAVDAFDVHSCAYQYEVQKCGRATCLPRSSTSWIHLETTNGTGVLSNSALASRSEPKSARCISHKQQSQSRVTYS